MIFYGRKASRLKDGKLNNVTCSNCQEMTTMTYSIFGKYAHIYWIPTFPMGKEHIVECDSCKQTFKVKELNQQVQDKYKLETQDVKTPIWNFAGLAILTCLVACVFYFIKQDEANSELYIETPQFGDVYKIEGSRSDYISTMKIVEVSTDSIFVVYNDYESDGYSISDLDKPENYDATAVYGFSNEQIKNMYAEKAIKEVKRN